MASSSNSPNTEDIVISGISGRFPNCNSLQEFKQNLLGGVDLITEDDRRWPPGIYGIPTRVGKLDGLQYCDGEFFGIHSKQVQQMDPQQRILLEVTFEAILDAGVNPTELRGTKTAVVVGTCDSDTNEIYKQDIDTSSGGYSITGSCRAMVANRISYSFDFNGPSYVVDTACSSGLVALHKGVSEIQNGGCDAAIVAGCNICLLPYTSVHFNHLNLLSNDGKCKSFDSRGDGFVRSEAIVALYLQKSKEARRCYAGILGSDVNINGYKEAGFIASSSEMQLKLMATLYKKIDLDPAEVVYVEAHGAGTKLGDINEANALAEMFSQNRKSPLLIGSVKSNMGHAEPVAGLCGIAKLIVAMECGVIPGNLHYRLPNPDIPSLIDGRLKVVSKNEPWNGGIVGINSFGVGGVNAHVVLRSNPRIKVNSNAVEPYRLVTVSGRTESAVAHLLESAGTHKEDAEYLTLVDHIHLTNIPGHCYRGYRILNEGIEEIATVVSTNRPIWFVYSGIGSQWLGMAKQMMQLQTFKNSIQKSASVLLEQGFRLDDALLSYDKTELQNFRNVSVYIVCIQIALTDVLTSFGIKPDGIIGHSVGEIACSYADGSLTARQAILLAYCRGRAFQECNLMEGKMASVGLTWDECNNRCPADIYLACHNSKDNVTVSGLPESIEAFVQQLQKENIFARIVKGARRAHHTKYIAPAGATFMKLLDDIIPNPRERSPKWISTSIPESDWGSPLARLNSPAYHVNNIQSPVLFYEALQHVPENAIAIEIAPHGLLQTILKRTLGLGVTNLSLMKKAHPDNILFFLTSIGKLFNSGCQPKVAPLYKQVSFPVSRGTPMIAPLVEWNHSVEWQVANFSTSNTGYGQRTVTISLEKEQHKYLSGHVIDGRILFPATGYLTITWKTFAKLRNQDFEKMAVVFEDIKLHRATIIPKTGAVKFLLNFLDGSGGFEIVESGSVVVSGKISVPDDAKKSFSVIPDSVNNCDPCSIPLTSDDIYKVLRLRGYDYSGPFRGITTSNELGTNGCLQWNNNWTAYMDTMLHFLVLNQEVQSLLLPVGIQRVVIKPVEHEQFISQLVEGKYAPVNYYHNLRTIKSGGIEIRGMSCMITPRYRDPKSNPLLETYQFVPLRNAFVSDDSNATENEALIITAQIALENSNTREIKIVEVPNGTSIAPSLKGILEKEPLVSVDYTVINPDESDVRCLTENGIKILNTYTDNILKDSPQLVVLFNAFQSKSTLKNAVDILGATTGFVLLVEDDNQVEPETTAFGVEEVVSVQTCMSTSQRYILLRKDSKSSTQSIVLQISGTSFSWVEPLKEAMQASDTYGTKIYLVSNGEPTGLVGMVNCLKQEPGGNNIRAYYLQSKPVEIFKPSLPFYSTQVKRDLVHNVLDQSNTWGTFRHLPLAGSSNRQNLKHAVLRSLVPGDLSSLTWVQMPMRDTMLATGKLPLSIVNDDCVESNNGIGFEFSGRSSTGRRVMGILNGNGIATTCFSPELLLEVPESWSLREAATVPSAYGTCYFAMIVRGQMKSGESILIHAGAGAVGMAAITLALHMGCTIFTTVGSKAKKDFLNKHFPHINDAHIGYSRDASFEQLIMSQTNGRGVDLVLNSLAGDLLLASMRCLSTGGRFLDIGMIDAFNNMPFGMSVLLRNRSFHNITLKDFAARNDPHYRHIVALVEEGIRTGVVKPLPSTVFADYEIEQAFRIMASGKHTGKLLIKMRDEQEEARTIPHYMGIPLTYFYPHKSYIIIGGLGGFGLELTNWMITRGATKVVLTSRGGVTTGYQSLCIKRWKEKNVHVTLSSLDTSRFKDAQELTSVAMKLGPIGGIFNLALVIRDALMENQTAANFIAVSEAKVSIATNFDILTRQNSQELDHFVLFSSVSCGRGNAGQSNYGFGNSGMERICEARHADGLPAISIQWGPIGDAGYFMESMFKGHSEIVGASPQTMHSCLATLDTFLQLPHPVVSSRVPTGTKSARPAKDISIIDAVASILGIQNTKGVSQTSTMSELGMDSLMVTDTKQLLESNYDIVLGPNEIRRLTFKRLMELTTGSAKPTLDIIESQSHSSAQFEIMPFDGMIQMTHWTASTNVAFFVHPIEGAVSSLLSLAKLVKATVYGLQYTVECGNMSIGELAGHYVKQIETVHEHGPYIIVGYSFGAYIALEMGVYLESCGKSAKLLLLDDSYGYVVSKFKKCTDNITAKQNEIFAYIMSTYTTSDRHLVLQDLNTLTTLEEKLSHTANLISNNTTLTLDDVRGSLVHYYNRMEAACSYIPSSQIKGPIMYIRSKNDIISGIDYSGLDLACERKPKVSLVDGFILQGVGAIKVADIIQETINEAPDIAEA